MPQPPTPSAGHVAGARPWVPHLGCSLTPRSLCALHSRTRQGRGAGLRHQTPERTPSGGAESVCPGGAAGPGCPDWLPARQALSGRRWPRCSKGWRELNAALPDEER